AGPITQLLQPGRAAQDLELATDLMRIVFLSMGFLVLSAWCLGILNSHRHFFLSYMAPVLWNATQIIVLLALVLNDWNGVSAAKAVAWAMFIGGVAQFLVQLPTVVRVAGPIRPSLNAKLQSVKEMRRRFVPAILAKGAVQISTFVDLMLASFLAVGALGAMRFAQTLYILPISIFAMSVAAAELPELSRAGADHLGEIVNRLSVGVMRIAFYVSFAAVAYVLAGDLIIAALFGWTASLFGSNTWTDDQTLLVWAVLAAYSFGLIGISVSRLFQNTCWALGDVIGPTRITVIRLVIAAFVGVTLMFTFDQLLIVDGRFSGFAEISGLRLTPLSDALRTGDNLPLRLGAVGLGLGSAVGVWIEFALLHRRVSRRIHQTNLSPGTGKLLAPGLLIAIVLVIALRFVTASLTPPLAAILTVGLPGIAYIAISAKVGAQPAVTLVRGFLGQVRR
ncbi:MAG: lipid II flippase MurJ, partial [Acidimicrobiales bacterium]